MVGSDRGDSQRLSWNDRSMLPGYDSCLLVGRGGGNMCASLKLRREGTWQSSPGRNCEAYVAAGLQTPNLQSDVQGGEKDIGPEVSKYSTNCTGMIRPQGPPKET